MTLSEKVGQMFIARCPSVDADIYAKKYNLGGYILFGQDFKNSDPDYRFHAEPHGQSH